MPTRCNVRCGVFYFFSKVLDLLFAPLTWALLALAFAGYSLRRPRGIARARIAVLVAFFVLLTCSLDAVANRLVRGLESSAKNERRDGVHYDAIILLGGMLEDRQTASSMSPALNERAERLTVSFKLLRDNAADFVLITGASDVQQANEADVLADELIRFGIAPARIVREGKAKNTRENALFSLEIATARGWSKLLLLTSAFHMQRAQGCYNAVGLPTDAYPVDFASYDATAFGSVWQPRVHAFNMTSWALRELSGRLIYRLRGYTTTEVRALPAAAPANGTPLP
jgi:uncharacterized SAM-binding protein YcdF (DUF218 family)